MRSRRSLAFTLFAVLAASCLAHSARSIAQSAPPASPPERSSEPRTERPRKPQTRPSGAKVAVDPKLLEVEDGDTGTIAWASGDTEVVRILGIDTPETRHPGVGLPYAQSFGPEARAFALGSFGMADRIELLRSPTLDPYGRTLGYFFLNGKNYSVLVVKARLAEESVTRYGDNGLPNEAADVLAAAKAAGPVPFESPGEYRRRMRAVSDWMRSHGVHAEQ
jgi:endonuclease YncB( thermonuclease family)